MIDVKAIAKAVAHELQRNESLVMTATDVALLCGYQPDSTPVRRMLADPTFPASVSLVDGGQRRWLRSEVVEWVKHKFAVEDYPSRDAVTAASGR